MPAGKAGGTFFSLKPGSMSDFIHHLFPGPGVFRAAVREHELLRSRSAVSGADVGEMAHVSTQDHTRHVIGMITGDGEVKSLFFASKQREFHYFF